MRMRMMSVLSTAGEVLLRPRFSTYVVCVSLALLVLESEQLALSSSIRPHQSKKPKARPGGYIRVLTEYTGRLWEETNPEARRRIVGNKAEEALLQMKQITQLDEYKNSAEGKQLIIACNDMLRAIRLNRTMEEVTNQVNGLNSTESDYENHEQTGNAPAAVPTTKNSKSVWRGIIMGMIVASWVFSGNYIFTGLFTVMTIVGQLEYYRMVINTGVYPARRISVVGACSMFLTAFFTPNLHQICLPLFGLWAMIWFLTMKRTVTTIPEIATTFTGMFYLGYVPSFWVRTRLIGGTYEPTRLAPIAGPVLNYIQTEARPVLPTFISQAIHLPINNGSVFIFWSWLCLAMSDVGAYFVGKNFGKTKLGRVSPAAGATSPNKTVEGVIGGCVVSAVFGILGAWVQRWPKFVLTGAVHGLILGLLGLIGDLTASMLKRDAGIKDFGDLIPGHGGILDRVDSFVWSAPYAWIVCAYILPALRAMG